MYAQITVTALSAVALADVLGLEASTPEAIFTRLSASNGETVTIRCSGAVWDRIRPQLRKLSQRRVPALDGSGVAIPGHTAPAMTYTQEWIPGDRPRIHQIEGAVVASTNSTIVLRGENLVPGAKAFLTLYRERVLSSGFAPAGTTPLYQSPEAVLTFTAVAKGPIGNKIGILIKAATGGGSVTTQEYADGKVLITVVPASLANDATSIAGQINIDPLAPLWVTATDVIGAAKIPAFTGTGEISGPNVANALPFQFLNGGDGAGIAFADLLVSGTDPTNGLRLTAQRSGNQGNLINVTLLMSQGSNGVAVTGNSIVVSRTGSTETLANLKTAINGNAAAHALVEADDVGSGSLGAVSKTYLAGGAGELLSAQIGGATAAVTLQNDTSMTLDVLGTALDAAGVATGEVAQVNVLVDYQRLSASIVVT